MVIVEFGWGFGLYEIESNVFKNILNKKFNFLFSLDLL
jgi:hypothetical protein